MKKRYEPIMETPFSVKVVPKRDLCLGSYRHTLIYLSP